MILSHTWKFAFIKGVKVAGTSLEVALGAVTGPEDIVTPITPVDELARMALKKELQKEHGRKDDADTRCARHYAHNPQDEGRLHARLQRLDNGMVYRLLPALRRRHLRKTRVPASLYYNHMPLSEVIAAHGPLPPDYLVFCIERSPYRKILSWANMQLSMKRYRAGGRMAASLDDIRHFLDTALADERCTDVLNISRYRLPDGRLGVETVLRYETLPDDFAALKKRLGLPETLPLPHAKKGLMSDTLDLQTLFQPGHIRKINDLFDDEFTAFGYEKLKS